jgi:threonine dehydrogenase-like Zn-dependent dehydrogenase
VGPAIYFQSGSAIFRLPDSLTSQGGDRARLCGVDRSAWVDRGCCITTADTVIVHESDPFGIASAVYAHLAGAPRVILVGGPSGRLQPAREIGVGDAHIDIFDFSDVGERDALVLDATPGYHGADGIPECAGVPEAVA